MKKIVPAFLVLAAIAVGAVMFLKRATGHHLGATEIAPANTIVFAHFPDLRRTAQRWPQTGLAKIWAEPEMQAFLEKPRAKLPQWKLWQEKLDRIARIVPGEAFVAVTSIDGPQPKLMAGFSFSGKRAEVESLLAEPRGELKRAWPAGKADIERFGATDIETFTFEGGAVAETFRDDWYLVANDVALLHSTLDRWQDARGSAAALASNDVFKKATANLPADGEVVVVAQLGSLTERLVSLLTASGQAPDAKQLADLKNMQAIAFGTKLEGAQVHDTIFVLSPGSAKEQPLARHALALSAADTFLYYAAALPATFEIPPSALALTAFVPGFAEMDKSLTAKGLKWSDLGAAFGPEFGVLADWTPSSPQPSALIALDMRDAAKAKSFAEAATGGIGGSPAWGREEKDGVTFFQSPADGGLSLARPAMAAGPKFLVAGLSLEEVRTALQRLEAGKGTIAQNAGYAAATKSVGAPTAGFGYLDLKTLFERTYAMIRPLVAMSLAFSPEAGQYIDAGKLPSTETISKHLTASVYSQAVSDQGTLIESVGTVTFNEVLIGGIGGAAASALPLLQEALAGGMKFDPKTLQLAPGIAAPGVVPVPPVPEPQQPKSDDAPRPPVEL